MDRLDDIGQTLKHLNTHTEKMIEIGHFAATIDAKAFLKEAIYLNSEIQSMRTKLALYKKNQITFGKPPE